MKRLSILQISHTIRKALICILALFFVQEAPSGYALSPDEILVIANSQMAGSTDLADYYMQKRMIPRDRLVVVSVSTDELISREDYERAVRIPVRNAIKKLREISRISCLVLFYGMPLKIHPPLSVRIVKGASKKEVRKRKCLKMCPPE